MKGSCACFLICFVTFVHVIAIKEPAKNPCGQQIPCDDYQCIDREGWCNGHADCIDGSDEKYCKEKWSRYSPFAANSCTEKHFECSAGPCVPKDTVCDGYKNCKFGSDEDNCENLFETEDPKENAFPEITSPSTSFIETSDYDYYESVDSTTIPATKITVFPEITPLYTNPPIVTRASGPAIYSTDYYQRRMENEKEYAPNSHKIYHNRPRQSLPPVTEQYDSFPGSNPEQNTPEYSRGYYTTPDFEQPVQTSSPRYLHQTRSPAVSESREYHPSRRYDHPSYSSPVSTKPSNEYRNTRRSRHNGQPEIALPEYISLNRKPAFSPAQTLTILRDPNGIYSPNDPQVFNSHRPKYILPKFYFRRNYTQDFEYKYKDAVQQATQCILDQRDDHYGWGEDTPRALIALSLVTNSFLTAEIHENDVMKKSLATHLGIKWLNIRKNPGAISDSKLALYASALLATCQDPRQFLGMDLSIFLEERKKLSFGRRPVNPLLYLTLCLINAPTSRQGIEILKDLLDHRHGQDERSKDRRILATTALACMLQKDDTDRQLRSTVDKAFQDLLQSRRDDGSFGSVYSTALAAQALMSINTSRNWQPEKTMNYLMQYQQENGCFGNMLATYYILPVLSGRSFLHLRNTQCEEPPPVRNEFSPQDLLNDPGPKYQIFFTLKIDYPENSSLSMHLNLPVKTNFFDAMRVAQFLNPRYRFLYADIEGYIDVHTIAGIPNDPERDYRWHLYQVHGQDHVLNFREPYTGNIRDLIPEDQQEMVFWYLRSVTI